jgi:hypothetical protein
LCGKKVEKARIEGSISFVADKKSGIHDIRVTSATKLDSEQFAISLRFGYWLIHASMM